MNFVCTASMVIVVDRNNIYLTINISDWPWNIFILGKAIEFPVSKNERKMQT